MPLLYTLNTESDNNNPELAITMALVLVNGFQQDKAPHATLHFGAIMASITLVPSAKLTSTISDLNFIEHA
jgi:hypothetical protein